MSRHTPREARPHGNQRTSSDAPRRRHAQRAVAASGGEDWDEDRAVTYGARERRTGSHRALADADSLPPRLRSRRAFALVTMTLLLPGLAQIVAGNRRMGRFSMRVWFAAIAVAITAVLLAVVRRSWLLGLVARSWVLFALAALAVLLAVVWLAAFVDAARLSGLRRLPAAARRGVVASTVLGMVLTAGPLAWGASALYTGGSVLGTVFQAGVGAPAAKGRYNILLLGGDSGAGRAGTRPDTIMLASIDADSGRTVTFGFARDTENIDFRPGSTMARLMPEGWNCGDACLLNGLYTWAMEHKDQFPPGVADPGALATREAVEALSGLDIQYYALIDLQGFQTLVDAVGGLDINVKKATPVGGGTSPIYEYIRPGEQHLNGFYALWYARSREGSSNYERMARQKCVLQAATRQVDPQTVLMKFRELAAAGEKVLQTDIPQSDLGALADLALKSRSHPSKSVNFVPPLLNPWDFDPRVIHDTVAAAVDPAAASATITPSTTSGRVSEPGPGTGGPETSPSGTTQGAAAGGQANGSATDGSDVCSVP